LRPQPLHHREFKDFLRLGDRLSRQEFRVEHLTNAISFQVGGQFSTEFHLF